MKTHKKDLNNIFYKSIIISAEWNIFSTAVMRNFLDNAH
jgi:hypothetical protein